MKNRFFAGLFAIGISAAIFSIPAEAKREDGNHRNTTQTKKISYHRPNDKSHPVMVRHFSRNRTQYRSALAVPGRQGNVVAMIKRMAPAYGVPTWFALRIAKVESGYNPKARGLAGELGVFQMKCATARGIGYRGSCSGLLDASTGVQYGLKHLSLALRSSGGNLKMAASKHNGGLGRKSLVPRYVAMVF